MSDRHLTKQLVDFGSAVLIGNSLISFLRGYELSNIASFQVPIREAFDQERFLSLINLAYPLGGLAMAPLMKELVKFCNLKWLGVFACILGMFGSFLAGISRTVEIFVCGRVLVATGSAALFQIVLAYNNHLAKPDARPVVQAMIWGSFAAGLLSSPLIGETFAMTEHATWRWAFFILIPVLVAVACLFTFGYPPLTIEHVSVTTDSRTAALRFIFTNFFRKRDLIGSALWIMTIALFGLGYSVTVSFSEWGLYGITMIWLLFGMCSLTSIYQQAYYSKYRGTFRSNYSGEPFTAVLHRKKVISLSLLCAALASAGYSTILFYAPLYLIFSGLDGTTETAIWLLPFLSVLVTSMALSGYLLVKLQYAFVFGVGAILMISGGIWLPVVVPQLPIVLILCTEVLVAAGVGLMWQAALPMVYVVLRHEYGCLHEEQRVDAVALFTMSQMGGISLGLVVCDTIYRNRGFSIINSAMPEVGFEKAAVYYALTGSNSSLPFADHPNLADLVSYAAETALLWCFSFSAAAGVLCMVTAAFMKLERLPLRQRDTRIHQSDLKEES